MEPKRKTQKISGLLVIEEGTTGGLGGKYKTD